MAVITISRGSYGKGKDVAEKVAQKLDYDCISRETILYASEQWDIPEIKLVRAIHDAPSILDRVTYRKEKYIAYIQAALVRHALKDNVVYHGLAGQFLLRGIPHVVKIRIIADMNDRVSLEMEREGISRKDALRILTRDDEQRRKWSRSLYGIDIAAPSLYDLVLHIKALSVDAATDFACRTTELEEFQTTPDSQKALTDLLLACEVRIHLVDVKPDVEVSADNGHVYVKTEAHGSQEENVVRDIKRVAETVPGVKDVRVHVLWLAPYA